MTAECCAYYYSSVHKSVKSQVRNIINWIKFLYRKCKRQKSLNIAEKLNSCSGSIHSKKLVRTCYFSEHYDVIKWKHFPRCWPFVRGIPRSPVNFPHKGQWRGALMFSLISVWINGWVNNREADEIMARRLFGTNPIFEPTLTFCSFVPCE